jgi:pre-mRNA-processing factor 8
LITQILPAPDIVTHASIIADNPKAWTGKDEVIITTSFTQGSCSLTAYRVTDEGLEWGKKSRNLAGGAGVQNADQYSSNCFEKVQMLLSDRFKGFFLVPDGGLGWNYNFQGVKHSAGMEYSLKMDIPQPFYAECHRPQHFLSFVQMEEGADEDGADTEDFLS